MFTTEPRFGLDVGGSKRGTTFRSSSPGLRTPPSFARGSRGVSLVELIVFIVLVSVAVAGVLAAMNMSTRASADPMTQKQALAIAEALLEEVELQAFTYCDPDDANAGTATRAALVVVAPAVGCANTVEASGPEGVDQPPTGVAETRGGTIRPFDNVNDYQGFSMNGVSDVGGGTVIPELANYSANVTVAGQTLGGIGNDVDGRPQSVLVTVTVTGPAGANVVLHGYRVRYAPNALP